MRIYCIFGEKLYYYGKMNILNGYVYLVVEVYIYYIIYFMVSNFMIVMNCYGYKWK
jgi:hypothetical protein